MGSVTVQDSYGALMSSGEVCVNFAGDADARPVRPLSSGRLCDRLARLKDEFDPASLLGRTENFRPAR